MKKPVKLSRQSARRVPMRPAATVTTQRDQYDGDEVQWFRGGLSALHTITQLAVAAEAAGDDEIGKRVDWTGLDDLTTRMVSSAYVGAVGQAIEEAKKSRESTRATA